MDVKSTKIINFNVPFKSVKINKGDHDNEDRKTITISGHASTGTKDRDGDIILPSAWAESSALSNYSKNPIILAFHDHTRPIGFATEISADEIGLSIEATITDADEQIFKLVEDRILTAFSVGFMVKDADFDMDTGIFIIKSVELIEISIVSVPANPTAVFNVKKSFNSDKEFEEFKTLFIDKSEETSIMKKEGSTDTNQEIDLAKLVEQVSTSVAEKMAVETAARAEADRKEQEVVSVIKATAKKSAEEAAAKLLKEATDKFSEVSDSMKVEIDKAATNATEQSEEIEVLKAKLKSKMVFNGENKGGPTDLEKDTAVILAKALNQSIDSSDYFKSLIQKSGQEHFAAGTLAGWEEEFNTRIQEAMRENLVVEPLFDHIPMKTGTMNFLVNPDTGYGQWIANADFRSDLFGSDANSSTGTNVDHELNDKILLAFKLVTKEFLGYEEEEDSIVPLIPIIRSAMARRLAKSADVALLRGAGVAGDPITGLTGLGSNVTDGTISVAAYPGNVDLDQIAVLRFNLGIYGMDPNVLVLIVSRSYLFELMKDPDFKTVDLAGMDRATLRTGEVGVVFGVPVIVSNEFDNAAIAAETVTTTIAVLVRPSNFVVGEVRGIVTESDRDIQNQKNVLVSSRRMGFIDIDDGEGVAKIDFVA